LSRLILKERKKGKSVRAIYFKLRQKKGVNVPLLRTLIEEDPHSESAALEQSLLKYSKKMATKEEVRKVAQKLCRKGFSPELIFKRLQLI
jgi:SOS response regulatory protein OraA/RecX